MKPTESADLEVSSLISLFYDDPSLVGVVTNIDRQDVPVPSHDLLVHNHHMTVTVERFYESKVNVQVIQSRLDQRHYSRKILLARESDGLVVQYGIVRLNLDVLAPAVQEEIQSQETPLGRILINHNVLREVKLVGLCKIEASQELAEYFKIDPGATVFGRTALIFCDGNPAIELLEVVRG